MNPHDAEIWAAKVELFHKDAPACIISITGRIVQIKCYDLVFNLKIGHVILNPALYIKHNITAQIRGLMY